MRANARLKPIGSGGRQILRRLNRVNFSPAGTSNPLICPGVVIAPELALGGIPIISAILGAAIIVFVLSLVAGRLVGRAFGSR